MLKAGVSMVDMKLPTSLDRANHVGVLPCGLDGAFQHCRAESAEPNAWHSQPLSLWGQIQWRPTWEGGLKGANAPPPWAPQQSLQEWLCVQYTSTACFSSTTQRLLNTARLSPIATTTTRDVCSFMSTIPTPALSKCQILPVRFLADRFKSSYLLRQTCLTLTDSMVFSLGKRIK